MVQKNKQKQKTTKKTSNETLYLSHLPSPDPMGHTFQILTTPSQPYSSETWIGVNARSRSPLECRENPLVLCGTLLLLLLNVLTGVSPEYVQGFMPYPVNHTSLSRLCWLVFFDCFETSSHQANVSTNQQLTPRSLFVFSLCLFWSALIFCLRCGLDPFKNTIAVSSCTSWLRSPRGLKAPCLLFSFSASTKMSFY